MPVCHGRWSCASRRESDGACRRRGSVRARLAMHPRPLGRTRRCVRNRRRPLREPHRRRRRRTPAAGSSSSRGRRCSVASASPRPPRVPRCPSCPSSHARIRLSVCSNARSTTARKSAFFVPNRRSRYEPVTPARSATRSTEPCIPARANSSRAAANACSRRSSRVFRTCLPWKEACTSFASTARTQLGQFRRHLGGCRGAQRPRREDAQGVRRVFPSSLPERERPAEEAGRGESVNGESSLGVVRC